MGCGHTTGAMSRGAVPGVSPQPSSRGPPRRAPGSGARYRQPRAGPGGSAAPRPDRGRVPPIRVRRFPRSRPRRTGAAARDPARGAPLARGLRPGFGRRAGRTDRLGELAAGYLGVLAVGGATRLVTGGGDEWHTMPVSRLVALTRGRHEGRVTISLPAPVAEDEAPVPGPGTTPDSVLGLDSR